MTSFSVNSEFDSWQKVLECKKLYEDHSKTLLSISKSAKLKGSSELNDRIIYERIHFQCKAGKERLNNSQGHRKSSTYKKNCPVLVSQMLRSKACVFRSLFFLFLDLLHMQYLL